MGTFRLLKLHCNPATCCIWSCEPDTLNIHRFRPLPDPWPLVFSCCSSVSAAALMHFSCIHLANVRQSDDAATWCLPVSLGSPLQPTPPPILFHLSFCPPELNSTAVFWYLSCWQIAMPTNICGTIRYNRRISGGLGGVCVDWGAAAHKSQIHMQMPLTGGQAQVICMKVFFFLVLFALAKCT